MQIKVTMFRDKECKGSVRFAAAPAVPPAYHTVDNVYLSRRTEGVNEVKEITVIVEIPGKTGAQ
jgi:hypothetical protein